MPNCKAQLLLLAALIAASPAVAAPAACPEHFQSGQAPEVLNVRLLAGTRALASASAALREDASTGSRASPAAAATSPAGATDTSAASAVDTTASAT